LVDKFTVLLPAFLHQILKDLVSKFENKTTVAPARIFRVVLKIILKGITLAINYCFSDLFAAIFLLSHAKDSRGSGDRMA
jgi:hypothetical protein